MGCSGGGWVVLGLQLDGSVVVAAARDVGEERKFDKSSDEREKKNKLLLYATIVIK